MSNWGIDAQFLDVLNEDYLFKNSQIKTYLQNGNFSKFILVASKGMGKTLLLRYKREAVERNNPSILLIPQNDTADYVNLPASISRSLYIAMSSSIFWEDLWKLSISISALLNFPIRINNNEIKNALSEIEKSKLPVELSEQLKSAFKGEFTSKKKPSAVLDILIQSGKSNIEITRSSALHRISDLFISHVSSGCIVFIDSFDQALVHNFSDNLDIWCSAQKGLMKAAWELSRHNRHVKVFVTIRQEAYSSFRDTERLNISGSAIVLEYSQSDLKGIFETAIKHYEKCNSIEEFVGFRKMYNGYLRTQEDLFCYVCRHTIQIPRWLMKLGEEISATRTSRKIIEDTKERKLQQKLVADIVNRVSAEVLAFEHICSEMKMFFNGSDPEIFLDNLLSLIHSSIISSSSMQRILKKFAGNPNWNGTIHPLCLMYNLGFVGYVGNNAIGTGKQQIFKKPYQFDWTHECILPKDPDSYYLIHPSLHHLIQKTNHKFNFNKIKIGDGLSWGKKESNRIDLETVKIFISYSHNDSKVVEKIVDIIDEYLNDRAILHHIWLDKWKMRGGGWIQDQMYDGLKKTDYLILIASKHSIVSSAVSVEWKTTFQSKLSNNKNKILPLLINELDYSKLPGYLSNIHSYKFSEKNVIKLIDDLLSWHKEENNL